MRLAARHLPLVPLMIVSSQMQQTMQDENLHFLRCAVPESACTLCRDLGRNRNLAGEFFSRIFSSGVVTGKILGGGWKRQHVGCLVFPAKAPVQRLHLAAGSHQNIDRAFQSRSLPRARRKAQQCEFAQLRHTLLKNNQSPGSDSSQYVFVAIRSAAPFIPKRKEGC